MQHHRQSNARMKATLLHVITTALLVLTGDSLHADVIDFEGFTVGTKITNQYQGSGVLFRSNVGGATIAGAAQEATSGTRILVGDNNFSDIFVEFVNPITGAPATANDVSVNNISVGRNIWTITSKDINGTQLEQFVLQNLAGPANGLGNVNPISFLVDGIASIEFRIDTSPTGNNVDGIGIDDFSFTAVPEPQMPMLLAILTLGRATISRTRRAKIA